MTITAEQVVADHGPLVGTGALPGVLHILFGVEQVIIGLCGRTIVLAPDFADAYLLHLEAAACAEHGDWARAHPTDGIWERFTATARLYCPCEDYRSGVLTNARTRFLPKPEAKVDPPQPVVIVDGVRYVPEAKP